MLLKNKVAVITGAASGIGKEIAFEYARQGAKVVIADIDVGLARQAANEIADSGAAAIAVAMDATNEDQVEDGILTAVAAYGSIDILISNAGIQTISPITELNYAQWKHLLAVHLDGGFLTTRACMREMIRTGRGGSIIYMGSVHSHVASPLKAPYVAAKHGLLGLARVVAQEGAKYNIRSNVICPGFVRTPLVDRQIPEQAEALGISEEDVIRKVMLKDTVDGEFTTTQDVADTAIFLAAFPSNALTGQSIVVSHGWTMQ